MFKHPYFAYRAGTSVLFLMNGFLYGNWASRLPELQNKLEITHGELGTLLLVLAVGAVLAMPFTGWLSDQVGSHRVIPIMSTILCASIAFMAFPEQVLFSGIFFFMIGASNGAMDVTMNEQAVLVEREWGKSIMSSFHGMWSIGLASGAGSGALFAKQDILLKWHLVCVTVLSAITFLLITRLLIAKPKETKKSKAFVLPNKAIIPLGAIAFCGMLSESAMADWSAIFMNRVIGESEAFSAMAFGLFGAAMTVGRFIGDPVSNNFGKKKLMLFNGFLAATGFAMVVLIATKWTALIGFFLAGMGLANIVPVIYSTAGNKPGISPSMGIAMATTIGYTGFFVGPPAIGFLADAYGLRIGIGFALFLLAVMLGIVSRQKF